MSIISAYHALAAGDLAWVPVWDPAWFDDEERLPDSKSDGLFDWEPPADEPSGGGGGPTQRLTGIMPQWFTCTPPKPTDPKDGGWREATYLGYFLHLIPPREVECALVIGAPIIFYTGQYLDEEQAHEEIVAMMVAVGEALQARLDAMPGSSVYSPNVICQMFRAELNVALYASGRGYRARVGTPCVFTNQ